ncbi:MAG: hypothetical protein KCHDKBKB_01242 [Elusimicrobia bacterium]|nr:hypothetical protein [Elusimicrobiota bacterium]
MENQEQDQQPNPSKKAGVDGMIEELRSVLEGLGRATPPPSPQNPSVPSSAVPEGQSNPSVSNSPPSNGSPSDADFWKGNVLGWPSAPPSPPTSKYEKPALEGEPFSLDTPFLSNRAAFPNSPSSPSPVPPPPKPPVTSIPPQLPVADTPPISNAPAHPLSPEPPPRDLDPFMIPDIPLSPPPSPRSVSAALPATPAPVEDWPTPPEPPATQMPPILFKEPEPADPFSANNNSPQSLEVSPNSVPAEESAESPIPIPQTLTIKPVPAIESENKPEDPLNLNQAELKPTGLIQIACFFPEGQERQAKQFSDKLSEMGKKSKSNMMFEFVFISAWDLKSLDLNAWKKSATLSGADILFVLSFKKDLNLFRGLTLETAPGNLKSRLVTMEQLSMRALYMDILIELERGR